MEGGFRTALARLPFALVELHPDNGREFFNDHLKRLFPQLVPGLTLSRSRPYHKNDNRFVEQKNDALVRQYVGYARFDTPEQMAALYADMSVYYNLFQPVLHLVEKTVVSDPIADESPGGAIPTLTPTRIRRRWDRDQTPCERLVATGDAAPHSTAAPAGVVFTDQSAGPAPPSPAYPPPPREWKGVATTPRSHFHLT